MTMANVTKSPASTFSIFASMGAASSPSEETVPPKRAPALPGAVNPVGPAGASSVVSASGEVKATTPLVISRTGSEYSNSAMAVVSVVLPKLSVSNAVTWLVSSSSGEKTASATVTVNITSTCTGCVGEISRSEKSNVTPLSAKLVAKPGAPPPAARKPSVGPNCASPAAGGVVPETALKTVTSVASNTF